MIHLPITPLFKFLAATFTIAILGLSIGATGYVADQKYTINKVTKQAQVYMSTKAAAEVDYDITVKVSNCVEMPTKNDDLKPNWACRVTAISDGDSVTEILQFTPGNLSGKLDPVEKEEPQFDHSKDTKI